MHFRVQINQPEKERYRFNFKSLSLPVCFINLIYDFIDRGLLVARPGDNVLVVVADIAAQHRRSLLGHKYRRTVRGSPGVQQVVFARGDEPLAAVGKL